MAYFHAREEAAFKKEWARLRKEYAKAGMDEKSIQEMYEFDRKFFNSSRAYYERTVWLITEEQASNDDELAYALGLIEDNFEALSTTDSYFSDDPFGWIEDLEDASIIQAIKSLNTEDLTLLSLYIFGEFSQTELAAHYGISQKNICKKLKRIKKLLRTGV